MIFDVHYALRILPAVAGAATTNVLVTLAAMAVALIVGLFLAIGRMLPLGALAWVLNAFVDFVRTTPLLIQIYFLFYVLPKYGLTFSPLFVGVIALGVHYSTFLAEVYRSGIENVPRGQWEAATALGLSRRRTWTSVVLPQAIPRILPPLGNYLIGMFKSTPYLATITVTEMLDVALAKGGDTYRYYEPITLVAVLFIGVSYPSALFVRALERRYGKP